MKLRKDRQADRQKDAKARQAAYDKLSPQEKIAHLDKKLGTGVGAKKQRAKIQFKMK